MAQPFCKQSGLVESTLTLARGMKRNRNDRIEMAFTNALIVERRHEPARDQMAKINLLSVFKIKNHVSNNSASAISRDGSLEIKFAMSAVGARELSCDRAVEGFGTFGAKGRNDS